METATEEYYKARIIDLEATLSEQTDYAREAREAELTQSLERAQARAERYIESYNTVSIDRINQVEGMRVWTLSELGNGDITETQAESIAEIMGFELTSEFEATVSVEYYITVTARDEESAREVINEMDFETVHWNDDSITYLSANVESTYF